MDLTACARRACVAVTKAGRGHYATSDRATSAVMSTDSVKTEHAFARRVGTENIARYVRIPSNVFNSSKLLCLLIRFFVNRIECFFLLKYT